MYKTHNSLPEEQRAKLVELLNRRLADAIDVRLQSRQAYWNVKGPQFMALRVLFEQIAQAVEEDVNLLAARIVQLGGRAEGTAQAIARRSSLDGYWLSTVDGKGHLEALARTLAAFGKHVRYASEQATELKDADTADLFTEIARSSDKWLWFVETSQQGGS